MSNSDIPLLTDVVEDLQTNDAEYVKTQQLTPLPRFEEPDPPAVTDFDQFVIFEPDTNPGAAAEETATPHDEALPESAAHDALALAPPSEQAVQPDTSEPDTADMETLIAELQTSLAAETFELIDQSLRTAFSDMEARIFREISTNLREQIPELIDSIVRDYLLDRDQQADEGD